jgi:hypothetical protein
MGKCHDLTNFFNGFQCKGCQAFFNRRTVRLRPCGQLERFSQGTHGFIDRKSRCIGSDLEQHAAMFAEVDRVEIAPIQDVGDVEPCTADQGLVAGLSFIVRHTKGNMVDRPHTKPGRQLVWTLDKIDEMTGDIRSRGKTVTVFLLCLA